MTSTYQHIRCYLCKFTFYFCPTYSGTETVGEKYYYYYYYL